MNKIEIIASDDEQEDYASSSEDWTPQCEEKKRTIRTLNRSRKKTKLSRGSSSSESDDSNFGRRNNGGPKRSRSSRYPHVGMKIAAKDFTSGSFLVQKKDVQIGDPTKPPCLWRIDGKALLQKYEPFSDRGKTLHRSTSIYTGWSALDQDLYSPVTVCVIETGQEVVVELDWRTLKDALDSD